VNDWNNDFNFWIAVSLPTKKQKQKRISAKRKSTQNNFGFFDGLRMCIRQRMRIQLDKKSGINKGEIKVKK